MPNARIIHVMRDPVDTCISCFSKLFTAEQNHTYDLGEIGRYYKRYERLMAHWHRVLPNERILDVHYEDVVGISKDTRDASSRTATCRGTIVACPSTRPTGRSERRARPRSGNRSTGQPSAAGACTNSISGRCRAPSGSLNRRKPAGSIAT
jgi:hypothetical protein